MKILVVSGGYLPAQKYGGPVVSLYNFTEHLGDCYSIDILCKNHDLHDQTPFKDIQEGFQQVGKAQVCYLPDGSLNKKTFQEVIRERKPDCLYLSSIFDAKLNAPLLQIAKKQGLPVVYAPRGELNPAVLAMKGFKKKVFLRLMRLSGLYKNVYFQASSEQEREMTVQALKVSRQQVLAVPNLPSAPAASRRSAKKTGQLRIVFLARIHRSKNLAFAIEQASKLQGEISFDIYGPVEHEDYWQQCKALMEKAPENVRFQYCGSVPVGSAGEVFGRYDCFLFPTLSENYGLVIAEAVQAGTLPVISRGTTPWDDIRGGCTVPLSEPQQFTDELQRFCAMSEKEIAQCREQLLRYGEEKLDTKRLVEQTKMLFQTAISGGRT